MTAEKRPEKEPLLNTVARKLGHAAGTLTNVAQELSENISTLPETMSRKMRQVAMPGAARRSKKKTGRASGAKKARRAGTRTGKSSQVSIKLARGRRKPASSKKKR